MGSINVAITVSALTKIIPHPEDAECTTHTVFDGELRWRLEAGGHMLFAYSCDKFVVHGEIAEVVETFDLYGEDVDRFMITLRSIDEQCLRTTCRSNMSILAPRSSTPCGARPPSERRSRSELASSTQPAGHNRPRRRTHN